MAGMRSFMRSAARTAFSSSVMVKPPIRQARQRSRSIAMDLDVYTSCLSNGMLGAHGHIGSKEPPLSRELFEDVGPPIRECDSGSGHELFDSAGHEDLAGL